jgi:GntR family transcriptional regulator
MTGEDTTRQPKYRLIADALRRAIDAGEYGPGDRLPGENPLALQYGVAVMTARKALSTLRNEGVVESRKGAGFYVRAFQPIRRRGVQRLSQSQWGGGASIFSADDDRALTVDQVRIDRVIPPMRIAEILGIDHDSEACARSRRFSLEGRPVLVSTSYLPYELVAGTAIMRADTGPGGTYARLAELGWGPAHFREEIRCAMPSTEEAERLGQAGNTPVVRIFRTAFAADGRAVEVNDMTLDAPSYVLQYDFDA